MSNLIDPRNAAPANDDQRGALRAAYVLLGGAPKARRRTQARSVSVDRLDAGGLDRDLLLWLLFQGHLHHFREGSGRCAADLLALVSAIAGPSSSFTLTDAGSAFAARILVVRRARDIIALPMGDLSPCYSSQERVLSWGVHALKRYRQPSENQELVLCAAEELHWPRWFDDPLPRSRAGNSTRRAHDTIKDLNRWQNSYLVHFMGNGKGTGIGWGLR